MAVFLSACTGAPDADEGVEAQRGFDWVGEFQDNPESPQATMISFSFSESSEQLLNPERGYYVGYDILRPTTAPRVRDAGSTLAIALVRLDAFRNAPIDAATLTALTNGFAGARAAGIKVVLRFMYNAAFAADASRSRILGHLQQLQPILHANADVISVMQGGFIGAWGEWHTSTNGLDNPTDRAAILNGILDALPASRGVQIRTPMYKADALPGGPLTEAEAYTGTKRARVGHHNDCFLASASDMGTYASPVATWHSFVAADGRYTAIGGETCAVYEPRTNCAAALAAMADGHWSFLNREYHQTVVASWATAGCDDDIRLRLGYRFSLERVAHTEAVAPGGELAVELDVRNTGFAAPYNHRPIELVLSNGAVRHVVQLAERDARRWAPGETTRLAVRLRIPADAAPGSYTLALRLPDDGDALADDPRYAIRLANDGVWDADTGDNQLTDAITIDPSAPGPRDASAGGFVELR